MSSVLTKGTSLYNRWRPLHKTIASRNTELWSPVATDTATKIKQNKTKFSIAKAQESLQMTG